MNTSDALSDTTTDYLRKIVDRNHLLGNWRGRRLLACNAADDLCGVIAALASDDGSHLPPDGGLPAPPSAAQIREMQNQVIAIFRTVVLWNDGSLSNQKLQRF